ncbi:MAG: polyprenyl synthetase family protein [Lentimicrobiaceae bacterium]|nr:polyprenyl synthetase family protein [Lentimicrobiaceae bacterium]
MKNFRERMLIDRFLQEINWDRKPNNLYEPIAYILSQGGKRIRPHLCLLSAELFGTQADKALIPAASFEMMHNFTLIHDDIMDKADLRRGKPTVYKKWNTDIAILSGDALYAKAFECMLQYKGDNKLMLLELLNRTAIEICEGQQMDLDFESLQSVDIADYLEMIRLKTAVMLAACLQAGALVAAADEKTQQYIYDFGIKIGLAFQIRDDLLDVYADADKFGKRNGGDIAENKKTLLSLKALETAQGTDAQELKRYFSSADFDKEEKFCAVKAIYDKYEIKDFAEKLIDAYYREAFASLEKIQAAPPQKQPLADFVNKLINREF